MNTERTSIVWHAIRAAACLFICGLAIAPASGADYLATSSGNFSVNLLQGSFILSVSQGDLTTFSSSGTGASNAGYTTPTQTSWTSSADGNSGPSGVATSAITLNIDVIITNAVAGPTQYELTINSLIDAAYSALAANEYAWAKSEFALSGDLGDHTTTISLAKATDGPSATDSATDNLLFTRQMSPFGEDHFTITLTQSGYATSLVPEPASLALLAFGAIGLLQRRCR